MSTTTSSLLLKAFNKHFFEFIDDMIKFRHSNYKKQSLRKELKRIKENCKLRSKSSEFTLKKSFL